MKEIKMANFMTKRDIKSQKTKDNILKASIKLMSKYGAEAMTVKNICEEAGVSNGTFYHFFGSKDDIYAYFLRRYHTKYIDENEERLSGLDVKAQVKDLYLMHVRLCLELGLEFTSAYYSTSNGGLDSIHRKKEAGTFYIQDKCEQYFAEAQKRGEIRPELNPAEMKLILATIATGVMFHWCVTKGGINAEEHMNIILDGYLDKVVIDKK